MSKNTLKFRTLILLLFIVSTAAAVIGQANPNARPAEVFVLSTLHQYHGERNTYTFEELSRIIEHFRPDVIACELTPSDLKSRREQGTKKEYNKSVFAMADKLRADLVPLEPEEPLFSELVGLIRDSGSQLNEEQPAAAEAFSVYSSALYDYLFVYWESAAEVNSERTDAFFEVKHEFQNKLFGEKQREGWERWNGHFLEQILKAAEGNPGEKIIVLVGAEHSYWLRRKLGKERGVSLVEPGEFFGRLPGN